MLCSVLKWPHYAFESFNRSNAANHLLCVLGTGLCWAGDWAILPLRVLGGRMQLRQAPDESMQREAGLCLLPPSCTLLQKYVSISLKENGFLTGMYFSDTKITKREKIHDNNTHYITVHFPCLICYSAACPMLSARFAALFSFPCTVCYFATCLLSSLLCATHQGFSWHRLAIPNIGDQWKLSTLSTQKLLSFIIYGWYAVSMNQL